MPKVIAVGGVSSAQESLFCSRSKRSDRLSGTGAPNNQQSPSHATVFDEAGRQPHWWLFPLGTKTQPASAEAKSSTAAPLPPVTSQVPLLLYLTVKPLVPEGLWYGYKSVATINQFMESRVGCGLRLGGPCQL